MKNNFIKDLVILKEVLRALQNVEFVMLKKRSMSLHWKI